VCKMVQKYNITTFDVSVLVLIYLLSLFLYQWPYEAAALAFEAIPRTLTQNCGLNVIRTMIQLQGKVKSIHVLC
jgi:chaperonin GroEL (HSP60 family)